MTADDVVASINHHRTKDSTSFVAPIAKQILEIKANGPNAVIIKLAQPNADLPASSNTPGFTSYPASNNGAPSGRRPRRGGRLLFGSHYASTKGSTFGKRRWALDLWRHRRFWRREAIFAELGSKCHRIAGSYIVQGQATKRWPSIFRRTII